MTEHDRREMPESDSESESFEMAYVIEQVGDGGTRMVRTIETYPDVSTVQTEYEEDLPPDDPTVLTRQRSAGSEPAQEVHTTFAASKTRPRTYPAGFPFLPNRIVSTTESPAQMLSPSAVWRCDDPATVLSAL